MPIKTTDSIFGCSGGGALQPIDDRAREMSMMNKTGTVVGNYSRYLNRLSSDDIAAEEPMGVF